MKDYRGLLCHTQELDSHGLDPKKRNVIVWKGYEPYIMQPSYGKSAVSARDLEKVGALEFEFFPSKIKEIKLPDGTTINAIMLYPQIYEIYFRPSQMVVDLP